MTHSSASAAVAPTLAAAPVAESERIEIVHVVSPIWWRAFLFGPLEWWWGTLTYGALQWSTLGG